MTMTNQATAATTTQHHAGAEGLPRTAAPEVLTNLVDTKFYHLMPDALHDWVMQQSHLTDGAKLLWLHLYRHAHRRTHETKWRTRILVADLAATFGKSSQTIERQLGELVTNDMLIRYRRRTGPSTTYVTLPYFAGQQLLKEAGDRAQARGQESSRGTRQTKAQSHAGDAQKAPTESSGYPQSGGDQNVDKRSSHFTNDGTQPRKNEVSSKENENNISTTLKNLHDTTGRSKASGPKPAFEARVHDFFPETLARHLHDHLKRKLFWMDLDEIKRLSNEITFQLKNYRRYQSWTISYATNSFTKLIKRGVFSTPTGYTSESAIL